MDSNYWTRERLGRRTVIRGAGLGLSGLAGAALIGCGGDSEPPDGGDGGGGGVGAGAGQTLDATAAATADPNATAVAADQVRIAPGLYD
ncbi:MAG: hypothetical protein WD800_07715, partial [Dehalococcoidia bacterium]